MKKWWLAAVVLALLSIGFWGWGAERSLLWFLPGWVWYVLALTLAYAVFFALVVVRVWRDT
ncbi:MAG: hypothetical protein PHU95_05115 [Candidatus Thermoplasmatota archaeon]|nr:hypothetical protein [Candidatus Thermoplasmatota archaeon]MDD5778807.1 hypothetical protein [Candidatus Thermoplasmatota archaeon]